MKRGRCMKVWLGIMWGDDCGQWDYRVREAMNRET